MNIIQDPFKIEDIIDNESSIRVECKKGYTTTAICVAVVVEIKGTHVSCEEGYVS